MRPFLVLLFAACAALAQADAPAAKAAEATQVILDQSSPDIFPASWRTEKVGAKAEPLAEADHERSRALVERALELYPAELLKACLKKVYVVGRLEYSGVATAGTRSASSVYVVVNDRYSSELAEKNVHAEFSSILILKFPQHLDEAAWRAVNPPDFVYRGSGVQAVKSGQASNVFKPALNEIGFLHDYGQASPEEDFNSYASRLLIGDAELWKAIASYPKVKAKARLAMAFYEKLDAKFNEAFFVSLRRPDASQLTLQRLFTDNEFKEEKMETFQWSRFGGYYFTLDAAREGKTGKNLVENDAATGKKTVLATAQVLTPAGAKKPLSIDSYEFSKDESQALLFTNTKKVWRKNTRGDYWVLDVAAKKLRKLGGDAAASTLMFAKFSPDGTRVAFVRKNNLHVQSLADMKITALTTDGSETLINGTADWVNEEELSLRDAFRWSTDGSRVLFWQFDTKDVKKFWLVNQTDGVYQSLTTFPYSKAGEKNSAARLGVVSTQGGAVTWLKVPGDPREHYLPQAEWTPDGKAVLLQQFNRLQNTQHVMLADPASGEVKTLLTETDKAWVENKNTEPRWAGDGFIWLSECTGWRHAYLVSLSGEVKPITKGDFDLIEVTAVNNVKDGTLDFIASPENATQRYLYRVNLDGSGMQRLSPADQPGTHNYEVSEDAKWAVHTYSSMTTPPVVDLVSLPEHQTIRVLKAQASLKEKLTKLKLPKMEFLSVDIGDGIKADAWMMKAADFDATKPHPLLINVYGEPAGQTVKDVWGGQKTLWHWMLAQQGYVIASADTRGTPSPRGRDWRRAVHRQLGIMNSREEAEAVRALLKRFTFLDPKRVGIWGWSGGGSSSLDAIFRYPDLYQTAIAVAPVPDRRLYDSIYEERYMGLPKDNIEGYKSGSPITHAAALKGNLLIIHGTGDDNVHYQGVEKLMNELIAKNKRFTVMPYPNRDHAINTGKGTSRHLYELMTEYLHEHLPLN